jgi:hypothetical protein
MASFGDWRIRMEAIAARFDNEALRPPRVMTTLNIKLISVLAWSRDVVGLLATHPQEAVRRRGPGARLPRV